MRDVEVTIKAIQEEGLTADCDMIIYFLVTNEGLDLDLKSGVIGQGNAFRIVKALVTGVSDILGYMDKNMNDSECSMKELFYMMFQYKNESELEELISEEYTS